MAPKKKRTPPLSTILEGPSSSSNGTTTRSTTTARTLLRKNSRNSSNASTTTQTVSSSFFPILFRIRFVVLLIALPVLSVLRMTWFLVDLDNNNNNKNNNAHLDSYTALFAASAWEEDSRAGIAPPPPRQLWTISAAADTYEALTPEVVVWHKQNDEDDEPAEDTFDDDGATTTSRSVKTQDTKEENDHVNGKLNGNFKNYDGPNQNLPTTIHHQSVKGSSGRDHYHRSSSLPHYTSSDAKNVDHAIFYNVFLPESLEGQENALRIVREQLQQIQHSYAATQAGLNHHRLVVYYVTLGQDNVLTPELMKEYCGNNNNTTNPTNSNSQQQQRKQNLTAENYAGLPPPNSSSSLECHHVQHFASGSEVVTLAHLYEFCSLQQPSTTTTTQSSSRIVTYLHNKGSFHFNQINENWRPILTEAALSQMCTLQSSQQQEQTTSTTSNSNATTTTTKRRTGSFVVTQQDCNLCGLQFYSLWTPFVPGNMFTAKCDYVQKLIPPYQFAHRMEQAISEVVQLRLRGQLTTNILEDRKDFFGLERYSDEHWIASHPDVIPCDCDATGAMWKYHFEQRNLTHLTTERQMAPHIRGPPAYAKRQKSKRVLNQFELRWREYYYLAGNLVKWFSLYDKAPEANSRAWTWFMDGEKWKQAVRRYGAQAVNHMTKKYRFQTVLNETTFADSSASAAAAAAVVVHDDDTGFLGGVEPTTVRSATVGGTSGGGGGTKGFLKRSLERSSSNQSTDARSALLPDTTTAIFFDVVLPLDELDSNVKAEIELIQDQLEILDSSSAAANSSIQTSPNIPLRVFVTTFGNPVLKESNLCEGKRNLNCIYVSHYKEEHRGETPSRIHEYCQRRKSSKNMNHRVIHLRNQLLPGKAKEPARGRRLIRHLTMAVTSDICLDALRQKNQCNLCGLLFFTMYTLHMSSNIWASDCEYINQLLPPKDFADRMNDFISKVLIQQIWTRINFGIEDPSPDRLGLDGYAMEHWIGSHPSLLPCDLSTQPMSHWMSDNLDASEFTLHMGAHRRESPQGVKSLALEAHVRASERARMREFHFLPGHLLKWYMLYDTSPPPSSWVWSFFPDGYKWSNGVATYGRRVVEAITSKYELSELELHLKWAASAEE